jgi:hypothetical protein
VNVNDGIQVPNPLGSPRWLRARVMRLDGDHSFVAEVHLNDGETEVRRYPFPYTSEWDRLVGDSDHPSIDPSEIWKLDVIMPGEAPADPIWIEPQEYVELVLTKTTSDGQVVPLVRRLRRFQGFMRIDLGYSISALGPWDV